MCDNWLDPEHDLVQICNDCPPGLTTYGKILKRYKDYEQVMGAVNVTRVPLVTSARLWAGRAGSGTAHPTCHCMHASWPVSTRYVNLCRLHIGYYDSSGPLAVRGRPIACLRCLTAPRSSFPRIPCTSLPPATSQWLLGCPKSGCRQFDMTVIAPESPVSAHRPNTNTNSNQPVAKLHTAVPGA